MINFYLHISKIPLIFYSGKKFPSTASLVDIKSTGAISLRRISWLFFLYIDISV